MNAHARPPEGMHVAIDCLVLAARPSGVERAVMGLLQGLAEASPEAQRYSLLVPRGRESELPDAPNLTPVAAPAWTRHRAGRVLYEQTMAPSLARSVGADLLHGAAFVLPLRWRGPSVVTIHDAITLCHPEWCKRLNVLHYRTVMGRSARSADVVVVPSDWTRREVIEYTGVDEDRVRVAALGVGAEFAPAGEGEIERVRRSHGLSRPYLLCVGNVEPRKNLEGVIAAFEMLAGELPHDLVVAGKRGWRCEPICRAMARSPASDRIRWLDWAPHDDLPALYSGADLLVQWSLHEGFGLTPLEAMACGTPAVISDGGALPEVAGGAARLVPLEAGPDGLADELLRLLSHPAEREALVRRGAEHAAGFTWAAHARAVAEVYREVAGAHD